jgi:uncharacterized LabA/DUF88 family protein
MPYPFPAHIKTCRMMVFIDGENLAIRYGSMLGNAQPFSHVIFEKNTYVWSPLLGMEMHTTANIVRRYYYTTSSGDEQRRNAIHDRLNSIGIQAPRVFPKNKQKGSKRVDISLCVDMLWQAHAGNYEAAILVAGDEDYVPLVEAVKALGRQVFVWFVSSGLSPHLKRSADYFFNLDEVLFNENAPRYFQ